MITEGELIVIIYHRVNEDIRDAQVFPENLHYNVLLINN